METLGMATSIALGAEGSRASGYSARDPRAHGNYDEVLPALLHIFGYILS
jgi:hypothetical protein